MRPLKTRDAATGAAFHATVNPRVYETDGTHAGRIQKARKYVLSALGGTDDSELPIVEIGCGTGDISGYFSNGFPVVGYDCNERSIELADKRFPQGEWKACDVTNAPPFPCRVLVLCEFLEHIEDPLHLIQQWLPMAQAVVISHPLDEELDSAMSGGEHQWSYSREDFERWFAGTLKDQEVFIMGAYRIIIGWGKK